MNPFGEGENKTPSNIGAGDAGNPPVAFEFISVHEPELRGGRFSSYHTYNVTSVPSVSDNVYRRYSDFVWLSDVLTEMYPGVFVPLIPPKKLLGGKDESFINAQRRPGLERFLNRILRIPILAESAPFQMFLARGHTFEDGQSVIKQELSGKGSPVPLAAFQYYYPEAISQHVTASNETDIAAMKAFLLEEEQNLKNLVKSSGELTDLISKKSLVLSALSTNLQGIYTAERDMILLPDNAKRMETVDNFAQWHVDHKEREGVFAYNLHQHYQNELDDVHVLLALIAKREAALAKLEKSRNKASKWALPTTKCDTDKLRTQRELELQVEEYDHLLCDTMTKLIAHVQFKWTWEQRTNEFNHNMNLFYSSQAEYAQRLYQNFSEKQE